MTQHRHCHLRRQTTESDISVELDLDGAGISTIDTGIPFYDHMLTALSTHSGFDLNICAQGDLHVDTHHTIEDTAIVLGQALAQALGEKKGIHRFGHATIPLDEALAQATVDLSGRSYCVHRGEPDYLTHSLIQGTTVAYPTVMTRHVFEMIATHGKLTLHMHLISGRDPHHICEAQYKALARALRQATRYDPTMVGIPSTKGVL